jgi:hypothetical protein
MNATKPWDAEAAELAEFAEFAERKRPVRYADYGQRCRPPVACSVPIVFADLSVSSVSSAVMLF